jgi:hypothetical protein
MYVYGLTQLKVVFIIMYLHITSTLHVSAYCHRAIIRLTCEEMFSLQMWLGPIRDLVLRFKWAYISQGVFSRWRMWVKLSQ